jgi:hypothetical protein
MERARGSKMPCVLLLPLLPRTSAGGPPTCVSSWSVKLSNVLRQVYLDEQHGQFSLKVDIFWYEIHYTCLEKPILIIKLENFLTQSITLPSSILTFLQYNVTNLISLWSWRQQYINVPCRENTYLVFPCTMQPCEKVCGYWGIPILDESYQFKFWNGNIISGY